MTWQSFQSRTNGGQTREKKGLARNGLVQNPNKYSHGTHQDSRSTAKVIFPSKIKHLKAETLSKFLWMDMDLYLHTAPFLYCENSNCLNTCMPCYHAEITHADDRCMLISKTPIPWCFRSPVEQRGSTVASARGFKQLDGVGRGSGVDAARDMMTDERIATTSSSSGQQPSFAASTGRVEGS